MVTVETKKPRPSRLRVIASVVAMGCIPLAILAAFGEWQFGVLLAVVVVISGLTPPFSQFYWHNRT